MLTKKFSTSLLICLILVSGISSQRRRRVKPKTITPNEEPVEASIDSIQASINAISTSEDDHDHSHNHHHGHHATGPILPEFAGLEIFHGDGSHPPQVVNEDGVLVNALTGTPCTFDHETNRPVVVRQSRGRYRLVGGYNRQARCIEEAPVVAAPAPAPFAPRLRLKS